MHVQYTSFYICFFFLLFFWFFYFCLFFLLNGILVYFLYTRVAALCTALMRLYGKKIWYLIFFSCLFSTGFSTFSLVLMLWMNFELEFSWKLGINPVPSYLTWPLCPWYTFKGLCWNSVVRYMTCLMITTIAWIRKFPLLG